jgi:hypothetical protein
MVSLMLEIMIKYYLWEGIKIFFNQALFSSNFRAANKECLKNQLREDLHKLVVMNK